MATLSQDEIYRYSRHLMIPEVGLEGQRKLKAASVLIVGAGGLGSPAALYLAAAGVGRIGLVDFDEVEVSNLQRQIIHANSRVGDLKAESARDRLLDLNPNIQVDAITEPLTAVFMPNRSPVRLADRISHSLRMAPKSSHMRPPFRSLENSSVKVKS